ncbi:MAG TPA: hypothetical protein VJB92_01290 [Candidatus Paceibacterota bacterium]
MKREPQPKAELKGSEPKLFTAIGIGDYNLFLIRKKRDGLGKKYQTFVVCAESEPAAKVFVKNATLEEMSWHWTCELLGNATASLKRGIIHQCLSRS